MYYLYMIIPCSTHYRTYSQNEPSLNFREKISENCVKAYPFENSYIGKNERLGPKIQEEIEAERLQANFEELEIFKMISSKGVAQERFRDFSTYSRYVRTGRLEPLSATVRRDTRRSKASCGRNCSIPPHQEVAELYRNEVCGPSEDKIKIARRNAHREQKEIATRQRIYVGKSPPISNVFFLGSSIQIRVSLENFQSKISELRNTSSTFTVSLIVFFGVKKNVSPAL